MTSVHFNKVRIKIVLFLSFTVLITSLTAQKPGALKFREDGTFKIVQFTDVHLKVENKPRCDSVLATVKKVLDEEKPDLVVLTGDVVTSERVKEAWTAMTKPMADARIPWAVVFGNHDHEHGFTNKELMDYLVTLPFNLSKHGPANIFGSGNYILEVHGSKSVQTKALLYCFDSNAYTAEKKNPELGEYDWIRFDQIKWYREMSEQFTKKNKAVPVPALAFFHIPLPEYNLVKTFSTTVGDKNEEVSSPKINSGMYSAMLESKDIMGVF